jgi:hypothetical protein
MNDLISGISVIGNAAYQLVKMFWPYLMIAALMGFGFWVFSEIFSTASGLH